MEENKINRRRPRRGGRELLKVRNVCRDFKINQSDTFAALKDISFSVEAGDFLSVMGPSGSGKSTLLYILGGLDDPTTGRVWFERKSLQGMTAKEKSLLKKRDIGFVFQFYNLVPNLTVEDNILLPLILDGKSTDDYQGRLNELLKVIGIEENRHALPRHLSGGQQQRVAIARALIIEPKVILADEPIGNLDSKNGHDVMTLLKKINQDYQTTIIQVTHSEEAAAFGKHILRMKDGQIITQESVKQELAQVPVETPEITQENSKEDLHMVIHEAVQSVVQGAVQAAIKEVVRATPELTHSESLEPLEIEASQSLEEEPSIVDQEIVQEVVAVAKPKKTEETVAVVTITMAVPEEITREVEPLEEQK